MGIHPNAKGALHVYQLNSGDLEMVHEGLAPQGGTIRTLDMMIQPWKLSFCPLFISPDLFDDHQ